MSIPRSHSGTASHESQEGAVHLPGCHPAVMALLGLNDPTRPHLAGSHLSEVVGAPQAVQRAHWCPTLALHVVTPRAAIWARAGMRTPGSAPDLLSQKLHLNGGALGGGGGVTHTEVRSTAQDTGRILCGSGRCGPQFLPRWNSGARPPRSLKGALETAQRWPWSLILGSGLQWH